MLAAVRSSFPHDPPLKVIQPAKVGWPANGVFPGQCACLIFHAAPETADDDPPITTMLLISPANVPPSDVSSTPLTAMSDIVTFSKRRSVSMLASMRNTFASCAAEKFLKVDLSQRLSRVSFR